MADVRHAPQADPDTRPAAQRGWTLVLPVKGGPAAKRRLHLATATAPALPLALALDCLDAVQATPQVARVLVVTHDRSLAHLAEQRGAVWVEESAPGSGLLAAVADGVRAAATRAPLAVLLADLPCLRPDDLAAALDEAQTALDAGSPMVMVTDTEGTGTVLLGAARSADLQARFGVGSAAAHRCLGAVEIGADLHRLRRDVDTPAELAAAVSLGVGDATRAALGTAPGPTDELTAHPTAASAAPSCSRTCSTCAPSPASLSAKCS